MYITLCNLSSHCICNSIIQVYYTSVCIHKLSLYVLYCCSGERAGSIGIVCSSSTEREIVESRISKVIRPLYSNPPVHGARIVTEILGNTQYRAEWLQYYCIYYIIVMMLYVCVVLGLKN